MAIKGLTDEIVPRYPRIGKIRKGGEKPANGVGPDLDHFRFVSPYPEVVRAFAESYPGRPRDVRIFIPHDTVEDAFHTACEVWNKTGLIHRCDGVMMSVWREGARYVRGVRPCAGGHRENDPHRDAIGRLEFIIPELVEKGFVGYVGLETHSLHDILNITRVLSAIYKSQGTLAGVEFLLRRVKENISVPGWGEHKRDRNRLDKWLVRLEPSVEWVKAHLDTARRQALNPAPTPPAILPERVAVPESETAVEEAF
jgi:hypothetical protein